jgi:hypothetical protein
MRDRRIELNSTVIEVDPCAGSVGTAQMTPKHILILWEVTHCKECKCECRGNINDRMYALHSAVWVGRMKSVV